MNITLHPHQQEAVEKMHNGCVLWGGVGTGKTITSLAYANMRESGKKIVIITTAKKRDSWEWQQEAALMGIHPDNIEVSSWNKIQEYADHKDHLFIFDEQRLVGGGAWVKTFYKIAKRNRWILLSATPGDTWADYAPMFIANGWYKNITEFRREHAVYSRYTTFPKIEKWIHEGKLQRFRRMLLVEMPMARHTTRHVHYLQCDYETEILDIVRKRRWNVYEDTPIQNASELYSVMRKVVSTDDSRRLALAELASKTPKLIVFYNYNYELDILRRLCEDLSLQSQSSTRLSVRTSTISSMSIEELSNVAKSLGLNLPPWELSSTELSNLIQSHKTSNEESTTNKENESWVSTTSTTSPTATTTWSPPILPSARTSTPTRTRSRPDDEPLERTAPSRLRPSRKSLESTRDLLPPSTIGSPTSEMSWNDAMLLVSSPTPTESSSARTATSSTTTASSTSPRETTPAKETTPAAESFGWAEWNGHKHQPIPSTDRWIYLVQYTSGAEGWNCTATDSMAFWSLNYSWKLFEQTQGRIDRLNTPFKDLHYYILWADSPAEKPVMMSLIRKEDFQPR